MSTHPEYGPPDENLYADADTYLSSVEDTAEQLSNLLASDDELIGDAGDIFEAVDNVRARLAAHLSKPRDGTALASDAAGQSERGNERGPCSHFPTAGGASVRLGPSAILITDASGDARSHGLGGIGQIINTTSTYRDWAEVALAITDKDGSMIRPVFCFDHAEAARTFAAALESAVQRYHGRSRSNQTQTFDTGYGARAEITDEALIVTDCPGTQASHDLSGIRAIIYDSGPAASTEQGTHGAATMITVYPNNPPDGRDETSLSFSHPATAAEFTRALIHAASHARQRS